MNSFNPATMNPAAIILTEKVNNLVQSANKNEPINNLLLILLTFCLILSIIIINNKN